MNPPPGLSFSHAPFYWIYEESGRMKTIVQKFLKNDRLDKYELELLRWYCVQWVAVMPSRPDDYLRIYMMTQEQLMEYVTGTLLSFGIDPF